MEVHNFDNTSSSINLFLAELRDQHIQKDRERFRQNMKKIGMLMAYEISKSLPSEEKEVFSPLGMAKTKIISVQPVIIAILRASLPFFSGFLEIFPQSDSGFVGAYRISETSDNVDVRTDYIATGRLEGETLIIADPMLATGNSVVKAIQLLTKNGQPEKIHIASVVAAPEGIDYISKNLPSETSLWTCAIDKKLNEHAYIVPGLGDAGDLSFGVKI